MIAKCSSTVVRYMTGGGQQQRTSREIVRGQDKCRKRNYSYWHNTKEMNNRNLKLEGGGVVVDSHES